MPSTDAAAGPQPATVSLDPVSSDDREMFVAMALRYFRELNPDFVAQEDWGRHFWEGLTGNPRLHLCWILTNRQRVGFILFGVEEHLFLPRRAGVVYELYILPEFRLCGIARASAKQAMGVMQSLGASKLQLEIMADNVKAAAFWKSLGFSKFAERWVLTQKD